MSHQDWGDNAKPLVIDTSVVINLVACAHGDTIANLLTHPIVIPNVVVGELELGAEAGNSDAAVLSGWISRGIVQQATLSTTALEIYERLISGVASTSLDDGEAATIAQAYDVEGIAVVDERKATRICKEMFPSVPCISTVDVFLHPNVSQKLGQNILNDAIFKALTDARMRVLPHHQQTIADLLGPERVAACTSLPSRLRNSE